MVYTIVTRGVPTGHCAELYLDKVRALKVASTFNGTGTCTAVRVYECMTSDEARSATIFKIRPCDRVISCWGA